LFDFEFEWFGNCLVVETLPLYPQVLKKNDYGTNAVRPTCAPNRVPQEHEVSTTIKNSQAVWSEATRKREHPGGNYLSRPGK
jgi:hypothetical protein